ncbi:MAG: type IV pilin-like G/H family protein [Candidatus Omnitrophica bacterium]|nr:type IV pilin-like G/H family protein [Candidatus Omnitrophota bacterium]
MKKGFTLLELLIVIIIIGVLAVIALTQYRNLSERARMGEAKSVIGSIRTAQRVYHEENGAFATSDINALSTYITVPPADCAGTHWFSYVLGNTCPAGSTTTDCFSVNATRCSADGKSPNIAEGSVYSVWLMEDDVGLQEKGTNVGGVTATW